MCTVLCVLAVALALCVVVAMAWHRARVALLPTQTARPPMSDAELLERLGATPSAPTWIAPVAPPVAPPIAPVETPAAPHQHRCLITRYILHDGSAIERHSQCGAGAAHPPLNPRVVKHTSHWMDPE